MESPSLGLFRKWLCVTFSTTVYLKRWWSLKGWTQHSRRSFLTKWFYDSMICFFLTIFHRLTAMFLRLLSLSSRLLVVRQYWYFLTWHLLIIPTRKACFQTRSDLTWKQHRRWSSLGCNTQNIIPYAPLQEAGLHLYNVKKKSNYVYFYCK